MTGIAKEWRPVVGLSEVLRGRYRHTKGYTAHYKEVCDGE